MKKLVVKIDGKLYKVKKKHLKKYLLCHELSSDFRIMAQKLLKKTDVSPHNIYEHLGKVQDLTRSSANFTDEADEVLNTRFVMVLDGE